MNLNGKSILVTGGTGSFGHAFVSNGPWYYEMQDLGYNYRITDIQA